jgi:hypothetical protein
MNIPFEGLLQASWGAAGQMFFPANKAQRSEPLQGEICGLRHRANMAASHRMSRSKACAIR